MNDPAAAAVGSAFDTAATSGPPTDKAAPFTIGQYYDSRRCDGLVDEACIYKRVLSADEVAWLYNSGTGRAYSELTAGANVPLMMMFQTQLLVGGG